MSLSDSVPTVLPTCAVASGVTCPKSLDTQGLHTLRSGLGAPLSLLQAQAQENRRGNPGAQSRVEVWSQGTRSPKEPGPWLEPHSWTVTLLREGGDTPHRKGAQEKPPVQEVSGAGQGVIRQRSPGSSAQAAEQGANTPRPVRPVQGTSPSIPHKTEKRAGLA